MKVARQELDQGERGVRAQVRAMGQDASKAIAAVAEVLNRLDVDRARALAAADADFNRRNQEIHEACIELIALQQPVATDLREILSDLLIATELERIADHVADIARIVPSLSREGIPPVWDELLNMAARCREMLDAMLNAYVQRSTVDAEVIAGNDENIDRLNGQVVREVIGFMQANPASVANGTYVIWLTHHLERIGDRVTNIGEQILFEESGVTVDLNRTQKQEKGGQA